MLGFVIKLAWQTSCQVVLTIQTIHHYLDQPRLVLYSKGFQKYRFIEEVETDLFAAKVDQTVSAILLDQVSLRFSPVAATVRKDYQAGFEDSAMLQIGQTDLVEDSLPIL